MKFRARLTLFTIVIITLSTACSSKRPIAPTLQGPAVERGETKVVTLSNGADILVQSNAFQVEATFTSESFAELSRQANQGDRNSVVNREIHEIISKIRSVQGITLEQYDEIGYFTFLLPYQPNDVMGELKTLRFKHHILFNPVAFDRRFQKAVLGVNSAADVEPPKTSLRKRTKNFSGLERMGVSEFVKLAEADIGSETKVNGSSVRLGISDTGITLNHPSFLSSDRTKNRIDYMRDFTREGRVYFNPKAKFEVRPVDVRSGQSNDSDDLLIDAEIILTPKLPALPAADSFTEIKGLRIKASPELRAALLNPENGNITGAKLGILEEETLSSFSGELDINGNGKTDDRLFMIWVPGQSPQEAVVFFDPSGRGDFSNSKPLGDWNRTKSTISMFVEKVGFDLRADKLQGSSGTEAVTLYSASIVGYDPGNHGTHVAGIAAGAKTLLNDNEHTLARGVAPDATILLNRVCANNGGCNATSAIADLALNAGAEVINMSLGGLSPFNDGYGVQETVINRLTSIKNVLFVISAGNSGPGKQTIGSPSVARLSLSIGASATKAMIQRQYQWPAGEGDDDQDFVFFFSSRGPTAAGGFKPNLMAPGSELSSIQLNAAPGMRGGLDVYWGTSMAAPSATGAYALLLDAIKKFNLRNPSSTLTTDAPTLRYVLMETARPFDVSRFDPSTDTKSQGQYSWVDQGAGMINLPGAWKKLIELRTNTLPSSVTLNENSVALDYQVLTSFKSPSGNRYDGSESREKGLPAFGSGLYLDFYGKESIKQAHIARRLPENLASGPNAEELTGKLLTTADEFVLRTLIYGSDKNWIKAGVLDRPDCLNSDTSDLLVIGRGAELKVEESGAGEIIPLAASTLNICIDRDIVANELPPGDNGALILAYRTVHGKVAAVPSFIVPVYLTVPHNTLAGSTRYEIEQTLPSFGVRRNYVTIPSGTSVARIVLEVPAATKGNECSGVELMAYEGENISKSFSKRSEARAISCESDGAPVADPKKRRVVLSRTNPTPGIWDLHVFGLYKFTKSSYRLTVDYLVAKADVEVISGGLEALNGSFTWTILEDSMNVGPSTSTSSFEIKNLQTVTKASIKSGEQLVVSSPLGTLRAYPTGIESVTVTTENSPGNDIDLLVWECNASAASVVDPSCQRLVASGNATADEIVQFAPKPDKAYAVEVDGFEVKGEGQFTSTETLAYAPESGKINLLESASSRTFVVYHSMGQEQLVSSRLATNDLFTSKKYWITGAIVLRNEESAVLHRIPVVIGKP